MLYYASLAIAIVAFIYTTVKWDILPVPGRVVMILLILGMLATVIQFYPSK